MGVEIELDEDGEEESEVVPVWSANKASLEAFLMLQSQWRTATIGGGFVPAILKWLGLDYTAADVIFRRVGIEPDFGDLMVMEHAALAAFTEGDT